MLNFCSSVSIFLVGTCLRIAIARAVELPVNLVPDASFESPVGSWLSETGHGSCFAGREQVAGASNGKSVLAIMGWEKGGSKLLSPVISLDSEVYAASVDVRASGAAAEITVELALFDESGANQLASFGSMVAGKKEGWVTVSASGVKRAAAATKGRIGVVVKGPQKKERIELDRLGLFAGGTLGEITDNTSFQWFEAEELADGKAWKSVDHYPNWYPDLPSGMKMLAAPQGVSDAENRPAIKRLRVSIAGPHKLWARVMHTNPGGSGAFTLAVRQSGKVVASVEINSNDPALGPDFSWCWASLDANLAAGDLEIVLTRPAGEASWISRKIDLMALTNLLDYRPQIADFRPQGYLRFTNLTDGQEPFCLFTFVHRMQPPTWYVTPGILSAAGFSGGYYVSPDRDRWLAAGESSPWVKISDALVPAGSHLSFIATRISHTEGFVQDRLRGRLEFSVGPDRRIVKTVDIDQTAPRLLMTLPDDFQNKAAEIRTSTDFVARVEKELDKLPPSPGPVAQHLELTAILGLDSGIDDPRVVEREMNVLKRLGFNGTYSLVPPAKDAVAFYAQHGLGRHYGVNEFTIHMVKNGCPSQPDVTEMEAAMVRAAARTAPVADRITRLNLGDEPGAVPHSHFASCAVCKERFTAWLREQGKTPADLGVANWGQVVPVIPEQRGEHPELYYYTSLFRLKTFADVAKTVVAIAHKHFLPTALTNVNYSPPANWVASGTDLFSLQRAGGFEMGWSEDWLGYGAGPEQSSEIYALLRAAGGPLQPLGGYCVGVSGSPLQMRIKMYEMLAGGARHINVYAYGPEYATVDGWSGRFEIFPVIAETLHEFGAIDQALHGAVRRKNEIAILYSRTASIWAADGSTPQQDSYFTRWALCHAGYDADFIPEEDIVAGKLATYKVLYMAGPQLRHDAANAIAEWVRGGGVLFGAAGAGSRDEIDRPLAALTEVFGAESQNLKLEHDAGRPRFDFKGQPILSEVSSVQGAGVPAVSLNQICFREDLKPVGGAAIILQSKEGHPAGVLNSFGKGRAIRIAACPGLSYMQEAIKAPDYDAETCLPTHFPRALRDFVTWPARLAGAAPVATTDAPLVEVVRYDASDRCVVFLIDHNAEPRNLTITLPAAPYTRARTARQKPVKISQVPDGGLQINLDLNVTDAVVLEN